LQIVCGQCRHLMDLPASPGRPGQAGAEAAESLGSVACPECGHEISLSGPPETEVFDAAGRPIGREQARSDEEERGFAEAVREALEAKVHVNCGACGRGLRAGMQMVGKKTTCPSCGERIRIPYPGREAELEADRILAAMGVEFEGAEAPVEAAPREADEKEILEIKAPDDQEYILQHQMADAMAGREILDLAEAVSDLPELREAPAYDRPRAARADNARAVRLLLTLGALAAVLTLALWAAVKYWPTGEPQEGPSVAGMDSPAHTPDGSGLHLPRTRPAVIPRTGPKVPIPVPKKVLAVSRPTQVSAGLFAGSGGYFPARAGRIYCRVKASVRAGDDPLEFDNYGSDVSLKIGAKAYPSLGEPAGSAIVPAGPRERRIRLQPHQTVLLSVLFELPQYVGAHSESIGLVVRGVKEAPVRLGDLTHVRPVKARDGRYEEATPRNLKPLLRDPVMAAVQATSPQQLLVRAGQDGSLQFLLGGGSGRAVIRGAAKGLNGDGVYEARLTDGKHTLPCALRFAHGGNEAILYLSNLPFHQITFARTGWKRPETVVDQPPRKPPRSTGLAEPRGPGPKSPMPATRPGASKFFGV